MKILSSILVIVLLCLSSISAQTRQELKIGTISNPTDYVDSAPACFFSSSKNARSSVFVGNTKKVWLKINGQTVEFDFVKTTNKSTRQKKKGTRYTETYRSGSMTVRITYVVTGHEYNDGAEESNATVVVTKGNLSRTVKASGSCGM